MTADRETLLYTLTEAKQAHAQLQERLARLGRKMDKAEAEQERLRLLKDNLERTIRSTEAALAKRRWIEPTGYGAIVEFRIRYTAGGQVYTYVALRAGGRWFSTARGERAGGLTWEEIHTRYLDKAHTLVQAPRVCVPAGTSLPATGGQAPALEG